MNEAIKQALDLDNWTETRGVTCVDAVVCPHCGDREFPFASVRGPGLLHYCFACHQPFTIRHTSTPVGMAWQTWQVSLPLNLGGGGHCSFEVVLIEAEAVTIRDLNRGGKSVTNDAAHVVEQLRAVGFLAPGRKLLYFDSDGELDEIVWEGVSEVGFRPGPGSAAR